MLLKDLLHAIPVIDYRGSLEIEVSSLCLDSRKVVEGSAFVAVRGYQTDGHLFVQKAIESGASVVLVEELPADIDESVVYVVVEDSAYVLGVLAANFYGNPSTKLKLVGITGTNGKTTVATLLFNLFNKLELKLIEPR